MSSSEDSENMVQEDQEIENSDEEMEIVPENVEVDMTQEEKQKAAEKKKEEGNTLYVNKSYVSAIDCYTQAIELCPECSAFYGNRSACFIMMTKYDKALEDARRAVQLEPAFIKGHLREGKCHLVMGEAQAAVLSYEKVLQLDSNSSIANTELKQAKQLQSYSAQAESSFEKGDFRHVVFCMDRCIALASACVKHKVMKAECLALLKRYQESQELANDILRASDTVNPDAIYVRGLCLYYQDNVDKAFQHFQQVLRLAPDHQKAKDIYKKAKMLMQKKEQGNAAFRGGQLQEAYDLYTQALNIDPNNIFTNSKLYCNRATVASKLKKLQEAVDDCSKAVELDSSYVKAYLRRAKCYIELEKYEEAVRDYENIYKMDKSRENRQLLQDAKLELKKSKRKDFYKILGVAKNATEDEIKKAYRKRALLHHPDRHSSASEEVRKNEEKKFKEIGEAYSILSDSKKKCRYDNGQDMEEMEGHPGFSDIDPNMIFQTFFGGGPGGGSYAYSSQQQQGFPGGFQFQFG